MKLIYLVKKIRLNYLNVNFFTKNHFNDKKIVLVHSA